MKIETCCVGVSSDGRTNVWRVECKCGRVFSPPTSMFSMQSFQCPKCNAELRANWNVPEVVEA